MSRSRPRVVVLCLDEVGPKMAGTAIRSVEIARALLPHADVTLAAARVAGPVDLDAPVVNYERHGGGDLARVLGDAEVVVGQPQWPRVMATLERSGARLVFDLSTPEAIETLNFRHGDQPLKRRLITAMTIDRLVEALHIGHHFVASTDRQLDLWLGVALAERLLSPATYDADPTLSSRFALAPHGLPAEAPRRSSEAGLRATMGLEHDAEVVLWSSAIWEWLDAETPIRAMSALVERRPQARLVFMGTTARPSGRPAQERARALARELGLLGSVILINDGWVPYERRGDWLLEADCAVACHVRHLETRFAFRTRYLDCFWAGLPIVCTEGDVLADRIAREDLGATVPEQTPVAVADALDRVLALGRDAYRDGLAAVAADYAWPRATEAIVRFATAEPPLPRLGAGGRRRPAHAGRSGSYIAARTALDAVGLKGWPKGLS